MANSENLDFAMSKSLTQKTLFSKSGPSSSLAPSSRANLFVSPTMII